MRSDNRIQIMCANLPLPLINSPLPPSSSLPLQLILKAIKSNPHDWRLFSPLDRKWFHHFLRSYEGNDMEIDPVDDDERKVFQVKSESVDRRSNLPLSEEAQLLFVRLFQRKHRWLRRDQIKYEVPKPKRRP